MTNSALPRARQSAQLVSDDAVSTFPTPLGWIGILGNGTRVTALTFGHESPAGVRRDLERRLELPGGIEDRDWSPKLRRRIERFAAGSRDEFEDVAVEISGLTDFRRAVIEAARAIEYGLTVTYGQLAERAGFPGAARAVGQVMATNRIPLIIPCHRVVGAGGKLGGYSVRSGLTMKQRLLEMERQTLRRDVRSAPRRPR